MEHRFPTHVYSVPSGYIALNKKRRGLFDEVSIQLGSLDHVRMIENFLEAALQDIKEYKENNNG